VRVALWMVEDPCALLVQVLTVDEHHDPSFRMVGQLLATGRLCVTGYVITEDFPAHS
jgi:hypothetical protein